MRLESRRKISARKYALEKRACLTELGIPFTEEIKEAFESCTTMAEVDLIQHRVVKSWDYDKKTCIPPLKGIKHGTDKHV